MEISFGEKAKCANAITDDLKYIEGNNLVAKKHEFDQKRETIECICSPILKATIGTDGRTGGGYGLSARTLCYTHHQPVANTNVAGFLLC